MRFLHVADLHVGRRLSGFSLEAEQQYALEQIIMMARERADAVLIAGDLYDKSQPSGAAVEMVSWFLTELAKLNKPVFVISGNHDSPQQIAYCRGLLAGAQVHVAGTFEGNVPCVTLEDAYGPLRIHLLPHVRPFQASGFFPGVNVQTYEDAVRAALDTIRLDTTQRNVLLLHQFIAGGTRSESEMVPLGGLDAVGRDLFVGFDYVALGHLHSPQRMAGDRMCYSGSPFKYSLSEEHQHKAALLVELAEKGSLSVERLPYKTIRDVRSVRGNLVDLLRAPRSEDYVYAELTDEVTPLDAGGALLTVYPNLVGHRMLNAHTADAAFIETVMDEQKSPLDHFADFFRAQNGTEPDDTHIAIMQRIIKQAGEDMHEAD